MSDSAVPIAALAGGGVVVRGYNSGALQIIDGTGAVTDGGTLPVANPKYWGIETWVGELGGAVTFVAGPTIDPTNRQFLVGPGNDEEQEASSGPRIAYFVPSALTTPSDAYSPQQLSVDLRREVTQFCPDCELVPFLAERATVDAFRLQAARPQAVLAFIGHSIRNPLAESDHMAIGLIFADGNLIKKLDPQPTGPGGGSRDKPPVEAITSRVKIVFVTACGIGTDFKQLWGIDDNTKDRALVYATSPTGAADLYAGAVAFRDIARVLALGYDIDTARIEANNDLSLLRKPNNESILDRYDITGDHHVSIR